MKRSKTTVLPQTFCSQYDKNYPQTIFHCCFLQDNPALKVALHITSEGQLFINRLLITEAVLQRYSVRKVFFAKFSGKHQCQSLFFNSICRPEACNFIKRETLTLVFSCEFCEISKHTFFIEHLRWLLLLLKKYRQDLQKTSWTSSERLIYRC